MDLQLPGERGGGHPAGLGRADLNDHDTGYPFACLENAIISATRTAASAAVAADWLTCGQAGARPARVGFFGIGLIARYIHTFLTGTGWTFDEIGVHDLSARARRWLPRRPGEGGSGRVTVYEDAEQPIRSSDLVVLEIVAGAARQRPVLVRAQPGRAARVPRDLDPEILLAAMNRVDA